MFSNQDVYKPQLVKDDTAPLTFNLFVQTGHALSLL
jgi:hypothetical protein